MKNLKNKINMKKGFTLIELLVVVAIIALLSAVVLSAVDESRQRAEWRGFDADIIQIRNALQLYVTEYGSWPDIFTPSPLHPDITTLIGELNGTEFYDGNSVNFRHPGGGAVLVARSTRLGGGTSFQSCGGPAASDVFMTFVIQHANHRSEIFRPAYDDSGAQHSGGFNCFEIR